MNATEQVPDLGVEHDGAAEVDGDSAGIPGVSATYDPADNKLRLRCIGRLDTALGPELYARVRAAGFAWAPKQDLFVAPAWTPEREAIAIEVAGEIGDEDTTLADRAEQRAERFDGYRENRKADAHAAHHAVAAIADNIPLGQPILVGHHSERRARRDAERIRSGMAKAVDMWRTAEYWQRRAAGALRNARYKELPAVRARRIKGLEVDGRKFEAQHKDASRLLALWTKLHEPDSLKRKDGQPTTFLDRALRVANALSAPMGMWSDLRDGKVTPEAAQAQCISIYQATVVRCEQVVSAPQLFPTPAPLAERMVDAAQLEPGLCVLEPSAGTGVLVDAVLRRVDTEVMAYDIDRDLANALARKHPGFKLQVRCADFLTITDFQGCYPRIIMNPPFERGSDIEHIRHALTFLAPGGRLVALCADGPRQRETLKAIVAERGGSYKPLPEGSFKSQGTSVAVAMVVIEG